MTQAVCVNCGADKFGALTPCRGCGFTPDTILDKSKSIYLTDHNFQPDELEQLGKIIKSGQQPPYDSIYLASYVIQLEEESYFWANYDQKKDFLRCMRCKKQFSPISEEGLCRSCREATEITLSVCSKCNKFFQSEIKYCGQCGTLLSDGQQVSSKEVGFNLAIFVRHTFLTQNLWEMVPHLNL